jgi:hypothetical protein
MRHALKAHGGVGEETRPRGPELSSHADLESLITGMNTVWTLACQDVDPGQPRRDQPRKLQHK